MYVKCSIVNLNKLRKISFTVIKKYLLLQGSLKVWDTVYLSTRDIVDFYK